MAPRALSWFRSVVLLRPPPPAASPRPGRGRAPSRGERSRLSPDSLAAVVLLAASLASTAAADEVYFTDGSVQRCCQVIEETFARVTYTLEVSQGRTIRQTRRAHEVARVVHEAQPRGLERGLRLVAARRFADAIPDLVAAGGAGPVWARQQALRVLAEAHLEAGDAPAALRAFDALLAQFPTTRFLADALLGRVRALRAARDLDGADAALRRARDEIDRSDLGERASLRASLEEARLAAAASDLRGALDRYARLVIDAARDPEVLAEARVGHAQGLADTGDLARAAIELRDLLAPDDLPAPLAARASLLLADVHARRDRPREAFLAYLRVALVHGDLPEAPRAFREAARLCRTRPDLGGAARARELLAELARRSPGEASPRQADAPREASRR